MAIHLSDERSGAAMWLDYKNQPSPMQAERISASAFCYQNYGKDANTRSGVDSSVTNDIS